MSRSRVLLMTAALAASLIPFPSRAAGITRVDAMVTMSDGVGLDTTVYVPGGTPPRRGFPLLVRQHGGGSHKDNDYDRFYGLRAVKTGNFALLMYSHRGHGNSGGLFDFFGERTTRDFSEILDWADAHVPSVNTGNVGTWGYSQGGGESLLPAAADSRVRAIAVGNTFDSLNHALNPNDCFKFSFATGIFALAYKSAAARTDDPTALRWGAQWNTDTEDLALGPLPSTTRDAASRSPASYLRPRRGTVYDTGLNVPVFWSNSWEDALFPADHGLGILSSLRRRGIPTHLWFASGGHEAGANDAADERGKEQAMLEWFDEFLRRVDHGYASGRRPPVDYAQRVPGGGWRHLTARTWPVPGDGAGLIPIPGGQLCVAYGNGGCAYPADDLGPIVNTIASANLATEPILSNRAGPLVAQVPDSRTPANTLTFTSAPLAETLEFTGAPRATVRYRTTATRVAQFAVKVWDEDPAGARSLVWRGCFSDETPRDGAASFDLWPNSHVFPNGHRIAVTLSAVDFPTFKPDTEPQASTLQVGTSIALPGLAAGS